MRQDVLSGEHRSWVDSIADHLPDEDGRPYDAAQVVSYGYRYSYAQRHADNGVAPNVLRDLMGHKTLQATLTYYRVTEKRVRCAVDRLARHQSSCSSPALPDGFERDFRIIEGLD
jgi:integrase